MPLTLKNQKLKGRKNQKLKLSAFQRFSI